MASHRGLVQDKRSQGRPRTYITRQRRYHSELIIVLVCTVSSDRTHTQQLFLFVVVMCESVHQSSLAQTSSNETRVSKPPPRRGMLCVCHRTIDHLLCSSRDQEQVMACGCFRVHTCVLHAEGRMSLSSVTFSSAAQVRMPNHRGEPGLSELRASGYQHIRR